MPQRVLIQPAPVEYGAFREEYDALVKDMEAGGVLVRVLPAVDRPDVPTGVPASRVDLYDLNIHVGAFAGAIVNTAKLIEIVRRRLRGQEGRSIERHLPKI